MAAYPVLIPLYLAQYEMKDGKNDNNMFTVLIKAHGPLELVRNLPFLLQLLFFCRPPLIFNSLNCTFPRHPNNRTASCSTRKATPKSTTYQNYLSRVCVKFSIRVLMRKAKYRLLSPTSSEYPCRAYP